MLYLAGGDGPQIKGFGALEHHESTSVVLPEMMPKEAIDKPLPTSFRMSFSYRKSIENAF